MRPIISHFHLIPHPPQSVCHKCISPFSKRNLYQHTSWTARAVLYLNMIMRSISLTRFGTNYFLYYLTFVWAFEMYYELLYAENIAKFTEFFLIIIDLLSLYSPLTISSTRTRERVIEMLRPLSITTFNKRVWHSPKYVPDVCEWLLNWFIISLDFENWTKCLF